MSQASKSLGEIFTLSKLLECEEIKLSAWSSDGDNKVLVLYTGDNNFIYYSLTENEPIIKQVLWFNNPIHTPVSITFSPSGFFLLVLSKSCHLYILPVLPVIDSTAKNHLTFDTNDITIYTYPFTTKIPKCKSKSKSPNSSLSVVSSLSLQSSSSNSSFNEKQRSSSSSSSSFSDCQGNENVIKLKETLNTKCEICPTAVCWWQSIHNSQDFAVIGTKSGDILFIDLVTGLKIGETFIKGEVKHLSIFQDKFGDILFLLITATNNDQFKLILEQKSPKYSWSCKQNINGSEENDTVDSLNIGNGNGNYLPSARARLQGLKQMSAEKLASIKHKIAETRSKIGTKQGLNDDISSKLNGPLPANLNSVIGDTLLSPQSCRKDMVLVGYYSQSQFLTVHSMNLDAAPLFIHKMPIETEEVLVGDLVIFVISDNRTALQVISSILTEARLDKSSEFNTDAILGKWNFKSKNSKTSVKSTEEKPALAKPDLIPEDLSNEYLEKIINVYKSQGKVEEYDISKIYNLEKTKEELPNFSKNENCIIVTNRGVYVVELNSNIVKMALDLILEAQELEKVERICTIFNIDLQEMLELAGDIKLAALEFPTAMALYKLSRCGMFKSIIKLACGNHYSQVLNYSTMLMANCTSDMSLIERIHLGNFMLMAYVQQILKSVHNRNLTDKFIEFLLKNSYYNESLAVSVTGQSLLFSCFYKLITQRGLILEGYDVLVKLMDRFKNSKVLDWSFNKNEFWKCATEPNLIEAMVIKSSNFSVFSEYVSQHVDEIEPEYLNRLLKLLDPTAPTLRPIAHSFKKETSFDNDETQAVFPFGKLIELFILILLVKLHKLDDKEEEYKRELILPSYEVNESEDSSSILNEESFESGDTLGDEIWPIRKDIQGDSDKFKRKMDTVLSCGFGHTALIRNGCVYTWGHTSKGCLGHGPTMSRYSAPSPITWLSTFKLEVSVVSCGKFHTAALTNNGVYTWGCSRYGQLGLGEIIESPHPRLVTDLAHENVITVKCGQFHTLALTHQGTVFAWGWGVHGQLGLGCIDNQKLPTHVHTLKEHFIVDIAAGHGHSLVLSDKGHIYSFGSSVFGQLGTGNTAKSSTPVLVKGITGKVSSIATGYFHNLAVTDSNTLYVWGSSPQCLRFQAQARKRSRLLQNQNANSNNNSDGESAKSEGNCEENSEQLPESSGILDKTESEMHLLPSIVDTSNVSGKITQISCGCHHSALVTDCGGVYTWGRSIDGQLGNGGHKEVQIPTQINPNGFKADCISCGCEFTAAEEKHSGKIYCWGSNAVGQLGIPIKESATKSLDGKLVLLKSCKRVVRLLDRGAGSNTADTPVEISDIPPPTFTYKSLSKLVTSNPDTISHIDPDYSQRSLHFIIEKYTNFINLQCLFTKSLEYENFQAASKILLLQNKCKQSMVYQLKALQSLPKYHKKSGFYLEKQEEGKRNDNSDSSEIHLFTVEGGHEDLCDDSKSENSSAVLGHNGEEKGNESLDSENDLQDPLMCEYIDQAKYILQVYLNLNSSQLYEDFNNCFVLETGIQFWSAEKLPMVFLEDFFREKLDEIYYDFGYLLFCIQQKNDQDSILEKFSSSFLLEVTSKILSKIDKNESCVEYLETMSKMLMKDETPEKVGLTKKKKLLKRKKTKSETYLEEIRDNLQQQNLQDDFIRISYGDVIEENIYLFSCGHHHSLKSLQEDCKLFKEIPDEQIASKLMNFYKMLDSENRADLACPSCVRDYLRQ